MVSGCFGAIFVKKSPKNTLFWAFFGPFLALFWPKMAKNGPKMVFLAGPPKKAIFGPPGTPPRGGVPPPSLLKKGGGSPFGKKSCIFPVPKMAILTKTRGYPVVFSLWLLLGVFWVLQKTAPPGPPPKRGVLGGVQEPPK